MPSTATPTRAPAPPTYCPTPSPSEEPSALPSPAPSPIPTATPLPSRTFAPTEARAFVDVGLVVVLAFVDADAFNADPGARRTFKDGVVASLPTVADRSRVSGVFATEIEPTYAIADYARRRRRRQRRRELEDAAPSACPTTYFRPTTAPTHNPTGASNATEIAFDVEFLHGDAETAAAAAGELVASTSRDLAAALRDGTFASALQSASANASLFARVVVLANQTSDANAASATSAPARNPPQTRVFLERMSRGILISRRGTGERGRTVQESWETSSI